MPSQFTNNAELLALNFLFNNAAATRPSSWYVALSTTTPTTSAGNVTEPAGNGYARQSVVFGSAAGNPASLSNTALLTFTASGGDWGTITYIVAYTASVAGTDLFIGQLSASKLIQNGDSLQFAAAAITVTLT